MSAAAEPPAWHQPSAPARTLRRGGRGSGPQDGISESEQVGLLACVRGEVHDLWS